MKLAYMSLAFILAFLVASGISQAAQSPDALFSNQKIVEWRVVDKEYIGEFVDISIERIDNTHSIIHYSLDEKFETDISKCLDATCVKDISGFDSKDFNDADIETHISSLDKYPISAESAGVSIVEADVDLTKGGYIFVTSSGKAGETFKLGFGTITFETVETTNDVGHFPSSAIDSNGYVHISERSETNGDLRYCNNTAGSWACEVVDNTADAYYTSIAIDSNNHAHIAYENQDSFDLKYCNNTLGYWDCANIETGGSVGLFPSIAIDSNDFPYISHYNTTSDYLRFCYFDGSWTCEDADTVGESGVHSSLAIDSSDYAHIAHYEQLNDDLRYCNNTLGTWSCAIIESSDDIGKYPSIVIDSGGFEHIAYRDETNEKLKYCNNTAGSWVCSDVETGNAGIYPSIVLDINDTAHITSFNETDDGYLYCNNTLGTWNCLSMGTLMSGNSSSMLGRHLSIKEGVLATSSTFSRYLYDSYYNNTDLMVSIIDTINDASPPGVTINSPANTTYANQTVWFNVTLNEIGSVCIENHNGTNYTMSSDTSTHFYLLNTTVVVGSYTTHFYCNDTSNNWNGTETRDFSVYIIGENATDTVQTTFRLTDSYGVVVENVTLFIQKYLGGSWVTVANGDTDSSGRVVIELNDGEAYRVMYVYDGEVYYFSFSASTETVELTVDLTVASNFTSIFDDIYIRVSPTWVSYNMTGGAENVNFNYTIVSTNSSLTKYGMMLYCNATTLIYQNNVTVSAAGGSINYTYDVSTCAGNITFYYHFTKTGYSEWINHVFYTVVHEYDQGLAYAINVATSTLPSQALQFISIIVMIFVMAGLAKVNTELAGVAGLTVGGIFLIATWMAWEVYIIMAIGVAAVMFVKRRLV